MPELDLRDPGNLKFMDFHKYFFSKLAFLLNVISKSEKWDFLITQICEFTDTQVVMQCDIKDHNKSHGSKEIKIHRTMWLQAFLSLRRHM